MKISRLNFFWWFLVMNFICLLIDTVRNNEMGMKFSLAMCCFSVICALLKDIEIALNKKKEE